MTYPNPPISSDEALEALNSAWSRYKSGYCDSQKSAEFANGRTILMMDHEENKIRQTLSRATAPLPEVGALEMTVRDNARMRKAGTALAEAALRVIREYDGTHRLALAVADWSKAIADEGDRAALNPQPAQAKTTDDLINELAEKVVIDVRGSSFFFV